MVHHPGMFGGEVDSAEAWFRSAVGFLQGAAGRRRGRVRLGVGSVPERCRATMQESAAMTARVDAGAAESSQDGREHRDRRALSPPASPCGSRRRAG